LAVSTIAVPPLPSWNDCCVGDPGTGTPTGTVEPVGSAVVTVVTVAATEVEVDVTGGAVLTGANDVLVTTELVLEDDEELEEESPLAAAAVTAGAVTGAAESRRNTSEFTAAAAVPAASTPPIDRIIAIRGVIASSLWSSDGRATGARYEPR
jgi:hypothetical protein